MHSGPSLVENELQGLHGLAALNDLSLPASLEGYRMVGTAHSVQWRWKGHALVHDGSIVHQGVAARCHGRDATTAR